MNTNDYISLHTFINRLYMNPLMEECPEDFIIENIIDLIGIIGIPALYAHKEATIDITDYSAPLPCDFYEMTSVILEPCSIDGVAVNRKRLESITQRRDQLSAELNVAIENHDNNLISNLETQLRRLNNLIFNLTHRSDMPVDVQKPTSGTFVYMTDTFDPRTTSKGSQLSYFIRDNIITTSLKECTIKIAYEGFKVDEDGYPMITNNRAFQRAAEDYITYRYYRILLADNRININVYKTIVDDYNHSIGTAITHMNTPTYDQMEALSRTLNTLLPNYSSHASNFRTLPNNNEFKIH